MNAFLCFVLFFISNGVFADDFNSNSSPIKANKLKYGDIPVLVLRGSHQQMGIQYGQTMQNELQQTLLILKDYYISQHGVPYDQLVAKADAFYGRFPINFQVFIQGVAQGANLSLDDAKILNAMETMNSLAFSYGNDGINLDQEDGHCAFLAISPNQTMTKSTLIGRNIAYQFFYFFPSICKHIWLILPVMWFL